MDGFPRGGPRVGEVIEKQGIADAGQDCVMLDGLGSAQFEVYVEGVPVVYGVAVAARAGRVD